MNDYDLTVTEIVRVDQDCITKEHPFIASRPRVCMTIGFVTEGTMCYVTKGNASAKAHEGDVIILFPGDRDITSPEGDRTCSMYVDFGVEMSIPDGLIPRVCRVEGMRELFEELTNCWNGSQPGYKIRCREIIYKIINGILGEQIVKTEALIKYRRIKSAILRIESGFADDITAEELAKLCDMSTGNLTRLFVIVTGKTPIKYLRDTRIAYAKAEILRGERDISALSERCGYADVFSFSRSFKNAVGVSPSKYIE